MTRNKEPNFLLLTLTASYLLIFGCASPLDLEAERQALIDADLQFAALTAQNGVEGWLSFFAEDGIMMPDGAPDIVGKQAIRAAMMQVFSQPDYQLRWEPNSAHIAIGADLGYTVGKYDVSFKGPDGEIIGSGGRYVSIWRKDATGAWKVVLDIGNATQPPQ